MPDSRGLPYELDAAGTSYRSGVAPNGTQSVVFKIFQDVGGVHPQTWYKAFNYDPGKGAPISYDTLFKPGSEPLDVIFPVVQRELQKQTGLSDPILPGDGLDPANYQNFALTDDALIFSSVRASCLPKRRGRRGLGAAGDRRADPRVGRGAAGGIPARECVALARPRVGLSGANPYTCPSLVAVTTRPVVADRHPDRPPHRLRQRIAVDRVPVSGVDHHQRLSGLAVGDDGVADVGAAWLVVVRGATSSRVQTTSPRSPSRTATSFAPGRRRRRSGRPATPTGASALNSPGAQTISVRRRRC